MARYQTIILSAFSIILVLIVATPASQGYSPSWFASDINQGPYVDRLSFKIIPNQDQRILALQSGTIDMDFSFFDPTYMETLEADPNIGLYEALRNGYGHITINCREYPLNISGFRRAFAYAYNKSDIDKGWCVSPYYRLLDSVVPYVNDWCIEDQFEWHYYDDRADIGNQILDDLHFEIDPISGYRLAPNGEPFDIVVEYGVACGTPGPVIEAVDALHELHVNAIYRGTDFNNYIGRLDNHEDYDMVFYAVNFYNNDIDWLAYEYWSAYADVPYQNPTNFVNETYDSWRDQLLHGTSYEEVYEAAAEMQRILQYNVPRLVVYENSYFQGYRTDKYLGYTEDSYQYITGPWTMRNIHKLDGTFGGTVNIAFGEEPDSFNFFVTDSAYSKSILCELWPALYKRSPDASPWSDLAKAMLTETHSDNPAVPEGHTRFTIDIVHNATWSDGVRLTAEDVAFTFTYIMESAMYGNPAADQLVSLLSVYAPSTFRVVFEFGTESYWHFEKFAFEYIIPEHIFNNENGIGYEGWNIWNPVFDEDEPNVNCGPFIFTDFEAGKFYEITWNPLFHYAPYRTTPTTTTSTTTSFPFPTITTSTPTNTTNTATNQSLNISSIISYALISGSIIVIVFCIVLILRNRSR